MLPCGGRGKKHAAGMAGEEKAAGRHGSSLFERRKGADILWRALCWAGRHISLLAWLCTVELKRLAWQARLDFFAGSVAQNPAPAGSWLACVEERRALHPHLS